MNSLCIYKLIIFATKALEISQKVKIKAKVWTGNGDFKKNNGRQVREEESKR